MSVKNTAINYEQLDKIFNNASCVFFIGIGGASMSSLAKLCVSCGKRVFGYDGARNDACSELEGSCFIKYCSTPDSVKGMDLVIFTTAIDESNLEYTHAKKLGIPLVSRANFLGYIMSKYESRIAICGMHGKSTTTAMLGHIYKVAGREPTVFCGAEMKNYDSGFLQGEGAIICEACEYLNAFLSLCPNQIGITNIDFEHPDFFKGIDEVITSFQKFANGARTIFVNADNDACMQIQHINKITYGIDKKADYMAKIVHVSGKNCFLVSYKGGELCTLEINFFGKHFVYDALLAFAIAHQNGIKIDDIYRGLSTFMGTKRRLERLGTLKNGAVLIEDYAHHPSEIEASLLSLREQFGSVLCIFQPHTYSRSYFLLDSFKTCFKSATELVILPTFSAREKNVYGLSDYDFATAICGRLILEIDKILDFIKNSKSKCVVLLGAGTLLGLKEFLVKNYIL